MTVASIPLMVGVSFFHLPNRLFSLFIADPFDLVLQPPHLVTTTCADGSLGRTKDVEAFNKFYPAELMLQSRLVEDAALAHPREGMATITSF